jgi:hypothetical protein
MLAVAPDRAETRAPKYYDSQDGSVKRSIYPGEEAMMDLRERL